MTNNKPTWLELKPEHIDANFENVIAYLMDIKNRSEALYKETVELLAEYADEITLRRAEYPFMGTAGDEGDDEAKKIHDTRILLASLLSRPGSQDKAAMVTVLGLMQGIVPKFSAELTDKAIKVITCSHFDLGASWKDVKDFRKEIFAHNLANYMISTSGTDHSLLTGRGYAGVKNERIMLYKDKPSAETALSAFDDRIRVLSTKDNKLTQSEQGKAESIYDFTKFYISSLKDKKTAKKNLKQYSAGDRMIVKITKKNFADKSFDVETIDKDYEKIRGKLTLPDNIYVYYDYEFHYNLYEGDCIEAKLNRDDSFSILETFSDFIIERSQQNAEVFAQIKSVPAAGRNHYTLWTEDGYPLRCTPGVNQCEGEYNVNDYVVASNLRLGKGDTYKFIFCDISDFADDYEDFVEFQQRDTKNKAIRAFAASCKPADEDEEEEAAEGLDRRPLRELARMMAAHQRTLTNPTERLKILCIARIMVETISENDNDKAGALYLEFLSNYLKNLIYFARGDEDRGLELTADERLAGNARIDRRIDTIKILDAFGKAENRDEELYDIIDDENADESNRKIAKLISAYNHLDEFEIKGMKQIVRGQILKELSIDDEEDIDLEDENGISLGIEDRLKEFKTSFFVAPANAIEKKQELNIFKVVCSFLNSREGGTLYLGVNDSGYVTGLDSEIKLLNKMNNPMFKGYDGYQRHIQKLANHYFKQSDLLCIQTEFMYDNQVLAIKVSPNPVGVATLNDKAYIRINSESREMSEEVKQKMMAERMRAGKKGDATLVSLAEAIQQRKQVILHGYQSSNSNSVRDRNVEPFSLSEDKTSVTCLDLDAIPHKNKNFKVSRISNVEISDTPWQHEAEHKPIKTDIFGMSEDKGDAFNIRLRLNIRAKNLLEEQFPAAKDALKPCDDRKESWELSAEVYSLDAICRFYVGLAENIEIIDGGKLREAAMEYVGRVKERLEVRG